MNRWGMTLATLLITLVAVALPAVQLDQADSGMPLGFQAQVWVRGSDSPASFTGLSPDISEFASNRHVDVARTQAAPEDSFSSRYLYVASGAEGGYGQHLIKDGYAAFSRSASTTVRPWSSLNFQQVDPRGYYLVDSSTETAKQLAQIFERHGFSAHAAPLGGTDFYLQKMLTGQNLQIAATVALAAVLLVASTVLLDAKTYGTGRLHGRSIWWLMRRDAALATPGTTRAILILGAILLSGLWVYNRLHWFGLLLTLATIPFLALCVLSVLVHYLSVLICSKLPMLSALKGELPRGKLLWGAYLLRFTAISVAVSCAAVAVALTGPAIQGADDVQTAQQRAGATSYLLLNGSLGEKGVSTLLDGDLSKWFEKADLSGRIVLSDETSDIYWRITDASGHSPSVLVVNPTYFADQVVIGGDGRRLLPDDLAIDHPTLLVPRDEAGIAGAVERQALSELDSSAKRAGRDSIPSFITAEIPAGQEIFTYGSQDVRNATTARDAFLAVVPPRLRIWGSEYIDMNDDITLRSPGIPSDISSDPSLRTAIFGTVTVKQDVAEKSRIAWTAWTLASVTAALAVLTLIGVAGVTVLVYTRGWSRHIFVRRMHGWPPLRTHAMFALAEVGVICVTSAWAVNTWSLWRRSTADSSLPPLPAAARVGFPSPPEQVGTSLLLVTLSFIVVILLTRLRERSIVAARASDKM